MQGRYKKLFLGSLRASRAIKNPNHQNSCTNEKECQYINYQLTVFIYILYHPSVKGDKDFLGKFCYIFLVGAGAGHNISRAAVPNLARPNSAGQSRARRLSSSGFNFNTFHLQALKFHMKLKVNHDHLSTLME